MFDNKTTEAINRALMISIGVAVIIILGIIGLVIWWLV